MMMSITLPRDADRFFDAYENAGDPSTARVLSQRCTRAVPLLPWNRGILLSTRQTDTTKRLYGAHFGATYAWLFWSTTTDWHRGLKPATSSN
jgi:hypothetical protein